MLWAELMSYKIAFHRWDPEIAGWEEKENIYIYIMYCEYIFQCIYTFLFLDSIYNFLCRMPHVYTRVYDEMTAIRIMTIIQWQDGRISWILLCDADTIKADIRANEFRKVISINLIYFKVINSDRTLLLLLLLFVFSDPKKKTISIVVMRQISFTCWKKREREGEKDKGRERKRTKQKNVKQQKSILKNDF